ncbi:hypothetical protein ACFZCT_32690 [Streptomyces qaidamensis]|uniref:hypothetical protein n=1 Tax=Streptomyces qaidamensis TaxID=1783515 RepID=UPI0036E162B5
MSYPLAAGEGRSRALMYLAAHPDASAQEVARAAHVSLTTAKDARRRARAVQEGPQTTVQPNDGPVREREAGRPAIEKRPRALPVCADPSLAVRRLRADPSLRFTEVGRKLLRTLDPSAPQPHDWAAMASSLPTHCAPLIAELARHHAESWRLLAESLTERMNSRDADA